MVSLVVVLLSIALLSMVAFATMSYTPVDAVLRLKIRADTRDAIAQINKSYHEYLEDKGVRPVSLSDMVPAYLFTPARIGGLAWAYGSGAYDALHNGDWFCLRGAANELQIMALARLAADYSSDQYFLASHCGATATTIAVDAAAQEIALTFWVKVFPN